MLLTHSNELTDVLIADLKTHPRQSELFGDLPEDKIDELAIDMKVNGQPTAIEISPDNSIICGHQRVKAAGILGWTTIKARVRKDLAEEGEASVIDRLVRDNLNRRQLDPLGQARCYKALKDNARALPKAKRKGCKQGDLRDELAKKFDLSGRSLDRLVKVLEAPIEVQEAFSAKKLSMMAAGRVAGAPKDLKKKVAAAIQAGEKPEEVVATLLPKPAQKQVDHRTAIKTFIRHLKPNIDDLKSRTGDWPSLSESQSTILNEAVEVIQKLLRDCRVRKSKFAAELAKYQAKETAKVDADGQAELVQTA